MIITNKYCATMISLISYFLIIRNCFIQRRISNWFCWTFQWTQTLFLPVDRSSLTHSPWIPASTVCPSSSQASPLGFSSRPWISLHPFSPLTLSLVSSWVLYQNYILSVTHKDLTSLTWKVELCSPAYPSVWRGIGSRGEGNAWGLWNQRGPHSPSDPACIGPALASALLSVKRGK